MLTAEKIHKSFGPQVVLKDVSLIIRPRERVGVVGPNGAGKSTLLRILGGLMEPDKGAVSTHGRSVGYLSQESQCRLQVTVGEEMRSALPDVADVEARLVAAAAAVGAGGDGYDKAQMAALSQATDDLHRLETHTLDARIGRVLAGLGFELDATDRLTDTYSGGWQMRIAMAKLLLQEPDYLLLDEPTNHLDDAAKYWLMYDYIPNYPGAVVLISHDPDFLNQTVTRILELEDGEVKDYTGDFDEYQRLKAEERERQQAEYDRQQKELEKFKEFKEEFGAKKHMATLVKSREKQMEKKIELVEKPKGPARTIYLELPEAPRSNPEPVVLRDVTKRYGDKTVLDRVGLTVVRGDRIALTGPNGAGKSTLLKLIAGEVEPTGGEVSVHAKTLIGYFAQHQAEALDPTRTVLEETLHGLPTKEEESGRKLLARLLFRGDSVFKSVAVLSGGERSRVALAKFLLRPANLLLLDEPTNHLDPAARGVLEQALAQFDGTIIMASHDQSLIDSVATGIFYIEGGQLSVILDPTIARIQET
jgi:ATP-binding cassette subfamily F protein 3